MPIIANLTIRKNLMNPNLMQQSLLKMPPMPAKSMYERLCIQIEDFQNTLDATQEVGASLVSFNPNHVFHIINLGYHGPDMVIFYGEDNDGKKMTLLQHISQLNVLLIAIPSVDTSKPARRIGFSSENFD